ncbi:MAG: hypothetical protein ACRBI6_15465 [Acidimicrobiales bacterium]
MDDPSKFGSIAGVPLLTDDLRSGFYFNLTSGSPVTSSVTLPGGLVSVVKGGRFVLVRASQSSLALESAIEAGQQGLDWLALKSGVEARIVNPEFQFVKWRRQGDELSVSIVSIDTSRVAVSVGGISVRRSDGSPVFSPDVPARWQPCLRYFRYARTTDDLHDAYRNVFLAIEAVLSEIVPMAKRPVSPLPRVGRWFVVVGRMPAPDSKPEGEEQWLRRALTEIEARGFDLSPFSAPGVSNHVKSLVRRLYVRSRHPLFHSKSGRTVIYPGLGGASSADILESLQMASRLFLGLLDYFCDLKAPSSWFNPQIFESVGSFLGGGRVVLANDPSPLEDQSAASPSGQTVIDLGPGRRPEGGNPLCQQVVLEAKVEATKVQRVCLVDRKDRVLMIERLEDVLDLCVPTYLTIEMGTYFLNEQRTAYRVRT